MYEEVGGNETARAVHGLLAGEQGLEPRLTDPETVVLPIRRFPNGRFLLALEKIALLDGNRKYKSHSLKMQARRKPQSWPVFCNLIPELFPK